MRRVRFTQRIEIFSFGKTRWGRPRLTDVGDVHVVSNAGSETAISIHVYGANIGAVRRHTFDPATGAPREFVSGYHNGALPNLWDRSKERKGV